MHSSTKIPDAITPKELAPNATRKHIEEQLTLEPMIKKMNALELHTAIAFAKHEGWNPGRFDARSYYSIDPDGFWGLRIGKEIIGVISAVCYFNETSAQFAYIGLFIIKEAYRRQGYGAQLWNHAMRDIHKRIGHKPTYLYSVQAQKHRYINSGFRPCGENSRITMTKETSHPSPAQHCVEKREGLFRKMVAYDQLIFGATRERFFRASLRNTNSKAAISFELKGGETIAGYGHIRPCMSGFRIGPLSANSFDCAKRLITSLLQVVPAGALVMIDTPKGKGSLLLNKIMTYFKFKEVPGAKTMRMSKNSQEMDQPLNNKDESIIAIASLEIG